MCCQALVQPGHLLNGGMIGAHRGGSDTFDFDITDYLKPGANDLVVQVTDPTSDGPQPRGKQQLDPKSIWYTPVSGIWQTVWLEPVPKLHIENVNVTPDIDAGVLDVDVALNRSASDQDAVHITARADGKVVSSKLTCGSRPTATGVTRPPRTRATTSGATSASSPRSSARRARWV